VHCNKYPTDPVTTPTERTPSHELSPEAFAAFMDIVEKCRGISSPAPEEETVDGH
jgi:hypothetical protein